MRSDCQVKISQSSCRGACRRRETEENNPVEEKKERIEDVLKETASSRLAWHTFLGPTDLALETNGIATIPRQKGDGDSAPRAAWPANARGLPGEIAAPQAVRIEDFSPR